jgi:hypothetical protein
LGLVMIWNPAAGWRPVPGSQLPFDNGSLWTVRSSRPTSFQTTSGGVTMDFFT